MLRRDTHSLRLAERLFSQAQLFIRHRVRGTSTEKERQQGHTDKSVVHGLSLLLHVSGRRELLIFPALHIAFEQDARQISSQRFVHGFGQPPTQPSIVTG